MGDETWVHHFEPKSQHQSRMAPYKEYKEEFKHVLAVGKKHGWDNNGLILMNVLPSGTRKNSDHYTATLGIPNDYLCRVCPTKKISEV